MSGSEDTDPSEMAPEVQNPNAADPVQNRKYEDRRKKEDRETAEFWRSVMALPTGRRVMWGLIRDAHAFEVRFACGPTGFPNPDATWFQAGQSDVGFRLWKTLRKHAPKDAMTMEAEHDREMSR